MDLGDFEQDAWGTQLCSVWLQECLNLQVSDTRFKNMKNQKCGLGDWINMWKSLLCYPLALEATELWSFVIWSVSLCMCVYLVTTAFSWGSGPFFSIFFTLKFLQVHKAKQSLSSLTACAHREGDSACWIPLPVPASRMYVMSDTKKHLGKALPFYVRTHLS